VIVVRSKEFIEEVPVKTGFLAVRGVKFSALVQRIDVVI